MTDCLLSRRDMLALAGSGALMTAFPHTVRAGDGLVFDVYRKGARIGAHTIRFSTAGAGKLLVASELDLAVKVAFITAYRYHQVGEDVWDNDTLVATRIETDDDGVRTSVVVEARDSVLAVTGPNGAYTTALGAMTDLSFWNEAITRGRPLIDSQSGDLIDIQVQPSTLETIEVRGRMVEAARFPMAASRGRSGTVWYDAEGDLVQAEVITRGETLSYVLAG